MGFYQDHILPYLIHLAMRRQDFARYRERVLADAQGRVLEIGIGSGLNLPFYTQRAQQVIGLDPSPRLLAMARGAGRQLEGAIELVEGSAEAVPLDDRSIDTVVTTWTLCSIPDARRALAEMRRVLRPGGRMLVLDFGKPQNRVWRALYFAYLRLCVPLLGLVFCRNAAAYAYILESLKHYPAQEGVAARMRALGMTNVRIVNFLGGVMTINYGEKSV